MNLIDGIPVSEAAARKVLDELCVRTQRTLDICALTPEIVLAAAQRVAHRLDAQMVLPLFSLLGIHPMRAQLMLDEAKHMLSLAYLTTKLERELGAAPFQPQEIEPGIFEQYRPWGVLTHIAAGNAAGLPAYSVLEGLLAGNINLLKLPGQDDGLSTLLLQMLIEEEPRLSPYIYVFDLPSTDAPALRKLLQASDAAAVWGSDFAISGIRSLAPPNLHLIEWGHRLSFAYITPQGATDEALHALTREICLSEQQFCSSPQCVFIDTDSEEALEAFTRRFAGILGTVSAQIPQHALGPALQAEITAALRLAQLEEVLGEKLLLRGENYSVLAEKGEELTPWLTHRNIVVRRAPRKGLLEWARGRKGYLQTVGLACGEDEKEKLRETLLRAGVCRVLPPGEMSSAYAGEPHDGQFPLRRYTRRVVWQG